MEAGPVGAYDNMSVTTGMNGAASFTVSQSRLTMVVSLPVVDKKPNDMRLCEMLLNTKERILYHGTGVCPDGITEYPLCESDLLSEAIHSIRLDSLRHAIVYEDRYSSYNPRWMAHPTITFVRTLPILNVGQLALDVSNDPDVGVLYVGIGNSEVYTLRVLLR